MTEFIIQWYSRSIFNFQPSEIEQLFRKIETKSKQVITNKYFYIDLYEKYILSIDLYTKNKYLFIDLYTKNKYLFIELYKKIKF